MWRKTVNIKPLLDPSEPASVVAKRIAEKLQLGLGADQDAWAMQEIIARFNDAEDVEEVDNILDDLYDWADANRVWLGLK